MPLRAQAQAVGGQADGLTHLDQLLTLPGSDPAAVMSADRFTQQKLAAAKVAHLSPDEIQCRYCGEASAGRSFKGYAHRWGPTTHLFIARKPRAASTHGIGDRHENTEKPLPA